MSSSNLIRWSGLATLVGGVLLIVVDVAEFILFGYQPDSVAVATSAWIILQVLDLVAIVLIFLGLVGLYARQAEQADILGLIAFLVAFSGTAMVFGLIWSAAFILPALAEAAPDFLDIPDASLPGVLMVGYILSFVLFALGWLLLGLASLRTKALPRGAAVLLMVGAVLLLVVSLLELPLVAVVLGAALAWMGYALWTGAGEQATDPQSAT